jgi:hypothetical protein
MFVVVALLAMAGAAHADFGTISVTETHDFTGTWSVDMTMHITTVGAVSPQPSDWLAQNGQLYYPYTWNTAHPLFVSTTAQGFEQSGRLTNGGTPFSRDVLYSFTCPDEPGGTQPTAGLWAFWLGVWALDAGAATTWTTTVTAGPIPVTFPYDPAQPTPTPPPPGGAAIPVPSLNAYGIVAMVLMLIGVAILVMWRRN